MLLPAPAALAKDGEPGLNLLSPPAAAAPLPDGALSTADKLGVGIYSTSVSVPTLRGFQPAMVLIMDPDVNATADVRKNFPNALIVGRHFVPDGDSTLAHCDSATEDHQAQGAAFADVVAQAAVPLKGVVNAWVGDNEQATDAKSQDLACHAAFQTGFVERLQGSYGIDAVAGNDAPGALDPSDYPKYFAKPVREAAFFGVHAYGRPGATTLQTDDAGYYALRYRLIHDALVKGGVPLPKKGFLLTESGLFDGWRGMVADDKMAADFVWLEQQTETDPYVVGQFIYGIGVGDRYQPFEALGTSMLDALGAFNAQHAGVPQPLPIGTATRPSLTLPPTVLRPTTPAVTWSPQDGSWAEQYIHDHPDLYAQFKTLTKTQRNQMIAELIQYKHSGSTGPLLPAASHLTTKPPATSSLLTTTYAAPVRPTETQDEVLWVHAYLREHSALYSLLLKLPNIEQGHVIDQLLNYRDSGATAPFTPTRR